VDRTSKEVLLEGEYAKLEIVRKNLDKKSAKAVAILGSFDTWPLMDYCARLVVKHDPDATAITSRFIYRYDRSLADVVLNQHVPSPDQSMYDFLKEIVVDSSYCAVICYSTPAAHYIETDWCHQSGKPTLGIFFCRTPVWIDEISQRCLTLDTSKVREDCQFLMAVPPAKETGGIKYSYCTPSIQDDKEALIHRWNNVWCCMKSRNYCPFIAQGTSKNVLEYYLMKENMVAAALSRMEALGDILRTVLPSAGKFDFPWE
jgi:hypothetical protein